MVCSGFEAESYSWCLCSSKQRDGNKSHVLPKGLDFETRDRLAQQGWVEAVGFSPSKKEQGEGPNLPAVGRSGTEGEAT
jgi:hypothetical protein